MTCALPMRLLSRLLVLTLLASSLNVLAPTAKAAATPATAPSSSAAPTPTVEQRLASVEAYLLNADPSLSLRDASGKVPAGLHTPAEGAVGPGHNAWMMVSAALVLFMTLPGLALFYGGLVRAKNVLSIMAWCLGITSVVTVLWWACGYSLVFGTSYHSRFFGGSEFFFLRGVGGTPNPLYSFWVSQNVFAMFQLMFAIITPAVVIGAVVERMKFAAVMLFTVLWMLLIYCPLAHMMWGNTGLMNGIANAGASIKAIDFAGGTVVEMASGWSALILCTLVGPRIGYGKMPMPPHSLVLCMVGTGMLWVGWYGFNAGSAVGADGIAGSAFMATTLSAAVAAGTWAGLERLWRGKASVLGFCSGAVAGLVTVTPACGFIDGTSAIWVGLAGGAVPFFACTKFKAWLGYDDALDVFGVHGVGGTVGMVLTGLFATTSVNGNLSAHLTSLVGNGLWIEQLKAMGVTLVLVIGGTLLIGLAIRATLGLRPNPEEEQLGLDETEHGEHGYIHDARNI